MLRKGVFFIGFVMFFLSCSEDPTPLFEMKLETSLDINPGLDPILTHYFVINNVSTFFDTYAGNITADQIGSIRPGSCTMQGGFENINYNFIQEIYITAIDPQDPSNSGEIFYLELNPVDNDSDLQLFGSLLNVKDLFVNPTVNLEIRMKMRLPTPGIEQNRITFSLFAFAEE